MEIYLPGNRYCARINMAINYLREKLGSMVAVLRRCVLLQHKEISNYRIVCLAQEMMEKFQGSWGWRRSGKEVVEGIST